MTQDAHVQAPPGASSGLPEPVRKQYLDAMGIQVWYDPNLEIPDVEIVAPEQVGTPIDEPPAYHAPREDSAVANIEDTSVSSVPERVADSPITFNQRIEQCTQCELHALRKRAVAGEGNETARLMIISLAPVDEAGQDVLFTTSQKKMLSAMLASIGLDETKVYLTSLVKCQPPEQRNPYTSEMICCDDHLTSQIQMIQPEVILLMGEKVGQQLMVSQKSITDLRLRNHQHMGVPVVASYHPSEVLGSADIKRKVWQDLLHIKKQLA